MDEFFPTFWGSDLVIERHCDGVLGSEYKAVTCDEERISIPNYWLRYSGSRVGCRTN